MRQATWRLRIAKSSYSFIKNGHALNSHLEFLQTTSFKPYVLLGKAFLWLSLGRNQYRREGLWFVCLLYDGSTQRLTESGFMWFYVFFYGEDGNRTCDPWFTRHSAYPLHHGGFSQLNQSLNHYTLIPTLVMHLTALMDFYKHYLQNLMPSWYSEMLKSFHLDIKEGHGLNSHLEILQTTSSNPYFLLSRKLIGVFKAKWRPRIA